MSTATLPAVAAQTLLRQLREHEGLMAKQRSAAREAVAQAKIKMTEAKILNAAAEKAMRRATTLERQCEQLRETLRGAGVDPAGSIAGEPGKDATKMEDPAVRLSW